MTAKQSNLVTLRGIHKSYVTKYHTQHVLKGLNLTVTKGQFVSIMGPSGSGKSTLLNILGLIDSCDKGTYHLGEIDTSTLQSKEMRALRLQKIGFIFQSFNLIQSLTAIENVELPLALRKVPENKQREAAEQMLDLVGLSTKYRSYPVQMSVGEQQRVAIARAMGMDPLIILADEPTGNLDRANTEQVMGLLEDLKKKKGLTLIICSHNPSITDFTDVNYTIDDGKLRKTE